MIRLPSSNQTTRQMNSEERSECGWKDSHIPVRGRSLHLNVLESDEIAATSFAD